MEIKATEIRNGTRLEIDGEVFIVTDFQHFTPGKGRSVVRTKMKSVTTGRVLDKTFTSSEKVTKADLELRSMQYLYKHDPHYVFMDLQTYEQVHLPGELLGDAVNYLKENEQVSVAMHKGKPIGVDLPLKVDLRVIQTVPGVKGDTVSSATKPAILETGLEVQVPLFINEGDIIRIDTRDGTYAERA
jgi:elongation factor P